MPKLNILPKKSWHVGKKENVLRVKKDEADALAREEERSKRALLAEVRTSLLRERAKQKSVRNEAQSGLVPTDNPQHINFFYDVEQGGSGVGLEGLHNAEHEAEVKADQEKFERRAGVLTYVGQSCLDDDTRTKSDPWYLKRSSTDREAESEVKDKRKKDLMDPLLIMKDCVDRKKVADDKRKDKTHSKHKKSHKHSKSIEELRRERKKREEAERIRTTALLSGTLPEGNPGNHGDVSSSSSGRYNSQFNPHLARQK